MSYKPPTATLDHKEKHKFGDTNITGIFLGYDFWASAKWSKQYRNIP